MMNRQTRTRLQNPSFSWTALVVILITCAASAQVPASDSVVPPLVNYAGVAKDASGKLLKGVIGATFAVYAEEEGGPALWIETQNINASATGNFNVMLGATKPEGLPQDVFSSGQARWLGISYNGEVEQPRVALLSVPYALKAGDAQTLGGLPPSAFVLAAPVTPAAIPGAAVAATTSSAPLAVAPPLAGNGTVDFIPIWTDSTGDLGNSVLFQSGSGATARIGINTTAPTTTLDVKGAGTIRGTLNLPAQGVATAAKSFNSQPIALVSSAFNSGTSKAVNQTFAWQTQPVANDTASPSGQLSLLFASGGNALANTGLNIAGNGLITFATGQTFPGTGTITGVTTATGSGLAGGGVSGSLTLSLLKTCSANQILQWNGTAWACATMSGGGSITGVTAGTDLTGGGTSGNVTLNVNTTKIPQLNASNSFNGNQTITATGGSEALNVTQDATGGLTYGIIGTSFSNGSRSAAVLGQELGSGQVFGVEGYISTFTGAGAGVYGTNGGTSTTGSKYPGLGAGVWGDAGGGSIGIFGSADNGNSVVAYNNSSTNAAIFAENQDTGIGAVAPAVAGFSFAPDGIAIAGSGPVHSQTFNNTVADIFQAYGVAGDSPAGNGVAGFSDSGDAVAGYSDSLGTGVFGYSATGDAIYGESAGGLNTSGLVGQATAFEGVGVSAYGSNSASALTATSYDDTAYIFSPSTTGAQVLFAGDAGGHGCTIWGSSSIGDFICTGSKSAMVPLSNSHWVRLYAVESPENWFEDFGSGHLSDGSTVVALDPTFADTLSSTADYHVFLTANGDSRGLYVFAKAARSFEVREQGGGKSSIAFDYRIVARRKGYENIRMEDVTEMHSHQVAHVQALMKRPLHKPLPMIPGGPARPEGQMPITPRPAVAPPNGFPVQLGRKLPAYLRK